MAVEGPLLASTRYLFEELGDHIRDLPRFPLPVRLWRPEPDSELRVDLLITLFSEDPGEQESGVGALSERGLESLQWNGAIVTGSMPVSRLRYIAEAQVNALIEVASVVRPSLDLSVPETWNGVDQKQDFHQTGKDVIVGIVDTGIDLTHPSFRLSNGATRVLSFWDQSPWGHGKRPSGFDYGVEWSRAEIDSLLEAAEGIPANWMDPMGHGTSVAGVAAGNGRGEPDGRYFGLAPDADLILVALDAKRDSLPDTKNVIEAIEYVFNQARMHGKRAVVNLSHGAQIGPHQPTGSFERGVASMLAADSDRVLVVSAGNTAAADAHARFIVEQDSSIDVLLEVPKLARESVLADVWYRRGNALGVEIVAPNGERSGVIPDGSEDRGSIGGALYEVHWTPNVDNVGASQVQVKLYARDYRGNVPAGVWGLSFKGLAIHEVHLVDVWLERGSYPGQPRFLPPFDEPDCTVTAPATATGVIAVGAYLMSPLGPLWAASGRGPDRTGVPVTMLAAPGAPVVTARSGYTNSGQFAPGHGTSLAAAHVTGAVALLLEAAPTSSRDELIEALRRSARTDQYTRIGPETAWGAGKLDIGAALELI